MPKMWGGMQEFDFHLGVTYQVVLSEGGSTKISLNFNFDPQSSLRGHLPGELRSHSSFVLNDAHTFGNLIVNNLDFESQMDLVRIARKPPE